MENFEQRDPLPKFGFRCRSGRNTGSGRCGQLRGVICSNGDERGKIRARRVTGLSVQDQRKVAIAVKNAREMALLPYASTAR